MSRLTVAELRQALEGADPGAEVVIADGYTGVEIEGVQTLGARFEIVAPKAAHTCDCTGCSECGW